MKTSASTGRHIAFVSRGLSGFAIVEIFELDSARGLGQQVTFFETASKGALDSARREMARIEAK